MIWHVDNSNDVSRLSAPKRCPLAVSILKSLEAMDTLPYWAYINTERIASDPLTREKILYQLDQAIVSISPEATLEYISLDEGMVARILAPFSAEKEVVV